MKRKRYYLVFLTSLLLIVAFEFALAGPYSFHSCPAEVLIYSHVPQGFQIVVGPPLFSLPQYVLNPGSSAKLTIVLSPYDGNNLTELIKNYYRPGSTYLEKIGPSESVSLVQTIATGLSITWSSVVQESQTRAVENLTITASPSADMATYDLGALDCPGAILLTVGYLPFWQPAIGSVQLVTLLVSPLLAALVTFGFFLVERTLTKIRSHQEGDQTGTVSPSNTDHSNPDQQDR